MVWFNEVELKECLIKELKRNPKGSGFILVSDDCDAFIFNNNPQLKHLLIAMASWIDSGEGKSLKIVRDSKEKCGFKIDVCKDKKGNPVKEFWRLTPTGYSCEPMEESNETNPFL